MNKKIKDIEVLRGVAVVGVAFWHLFAYVELPAAFDLVFRQWLNTGVGVDLFFVISGFVIARSLLPTLELARNNGNELPTVVAFWIRRAWRLLPSAWLWLSIILILTVCFNRSGVWGTFEESLGGALSAFMNLANLRFADSFEKYWFGASFHYWSLSLEEQFYLLFPFLVLLFRNNLKYFLIILILLQAVIDRSMYLVVLRTDGIALGVLLAIVSQTDKFKLFEPTFLRNRFMSSLVVLMMTLGLFATHGNLLNIPLKWSFVALFSGALVFIASWDKGYLIGSGWWREPWVWLGARSYAIYLIHVPAIFAAREGVFRLREYSGWIDLNQGLVVMLLAVAATVILADINYRIIERPLIRRGARESEGYLLNKTGEAKPRIEGIRV